MTLRLEGRSVSGDLQNGTLVPPFPGTGVPFVPLHTERVARAAAEDRRHCEVAPARAASTPLLQFATTLSLSPGAREAFGVPEPNCEVVFTEHAGEDVMGIDRVGGDWDGA